MQMHEGSCGGSVAAAGDPLGESDGALDVEIAVTKATAVGTAGRIAGGNDHLLQLADAELAAADLEQHRRATGHVRRCHGSAGAAKELIGIQLSESWRSRREHTHTRSG